MTVATRQRILIVEDEALVAEDLRVRLGRLGYDVVGIVDRAEEVSGAVVEDRPDLVLMDIKLKGAMDGIEAGDRLRAASSVPFVFVTSHADRTTMDRAMRAEPFGYVLKPFDERAVQAAIEMALARHRSEQSLRAAEDGMRTILGNIADAVVVTDHEQRITFMNRSGEQLSRRRIDSALGRPFDEVFPLVRGTDGSAVPSPAARAAREFATIHLEEGTELAFGDGERIPVDDSAAPFVVGTSRDVGAVVVMRDASERVAADRQRRRADLELQEARRLESLGQLASGMAHDFNNLMTAVLGNAEMLSRELPLGGEHAALASAIADSARTAARICQRLRNYSRQPLVREPIDLRRIVDDTIGSVRVLLGRAVTLRVDFVEVPGFAADRTALQQIVMNLLINSSEAIGDRPGTITVRAGAAKVPPSPVSPATPVMNGDYVFLEVEDDGAGMTPEVRARVFEPFFTTKAGGRGLGLSGVLGIVRAHSGGVNVESTPGRGTIVRVLLPQISAAHLSAVPVQPPTPPITATVLLLVEEDPVARGSARRTAVDAGIDCIVVDGAVAALGVLERGSWRIGAAIVDASLRTADGRSLGAIVAERWPRVAVVTMDAGAAAGATLRKPFSRGDLMAALRQLAAQVLPR